MIPSPLPVMLSAPAQPYTFNFDPAKTALLLIDMQRDFLLEKGFGDIQGGDLSAVQASIAPTKQLLELFRGAGLQIFHTREGHKPDLSDCPSSKLIRQAAHPENRQHGLVIGDQGAMGRLLIRGEYGHDFVSELEPLPNEVIVDKPGKGAFFNTGLMHQLQARAITHLVVGGVTTECCFATTIREANDRGFECCGVREATAGYNALFKTSSLEMLYWSQGLFGFVAPLSSFVEALTPYQSPIPASTLSSSTPPQTPPVWDGNLTIPALMSAYRAGLSPVTVIESLYKKIHEYQKIDPAVWIYLEKEETVLAGIQSLLAKYPDRRKLPPLFGIPFSIKDSIDIKGIATTTACPPLAFIPTKSAHVFDKCIAQGAIFIGKTNLDQLATGLTGCRSPYGITKSVFNPKFISGGSSSGNAVSVGAKLVTFSLATDTAGSGRVPSGLNGIVGFKPTRGTLSAQGVTPACLSLDCVALMASTVADVRTVWQVCEGFDPDYVYAKNTPPIVHHVNSLGPQATSFSFGIPPPSALEVCNPIYKRKFGEAVEVLKSIGGVQVPLDWTPFEKAGQLLYNGTFVSERLASLPDRWLETNRDHLHPVILEIFENVTNRNYSAVEAYRDLQAKAIYTAQAEAIFQSSKVGPMLLVVPTTPTHWTITEVLSDPISKNSLLGEFTHFGNILDLNGLSLPAGTYDAKEMKDGEEGKLPFSITILGGSRTDAAVVEVARRFEEHIRVYS